MRLLSKIRKKDLSKEIVLVRVDFNLEHPEGALRLRTAMPTVKFLLAKKAKVVLLSHRGRPKGPDHKLTLEPAGRAFAKLLKKPVHFLPLRDFEVLKNRIKQLPAASVCLLENLRFNEGEEKNSLPFAAQLAGLGTMYVNDAFAVSHRANASVEAITSFLPATGSAGRPVYAGLRLAEEVEMLSKVMKNPGKPLAVIIGGAKIADKLGVIEHFWKKADYFLLGGGPGNTVLKAKGVDIQNSIYDPENVEEVKKLARSAKVAVPHDWLTGDKKILDIGPSSSRRFAKYISESKTVIWNGPMGQYEDPRYRSGSASVAAAIVKSGAFSVVGGGETVELISELGLEEKISFLSTGGGAMLEFLAGKKLPGLVALD